MKINYCKITYYLSYFLLFLYILLVYIFGGQEQYTIIYKVPMYLFIFIQVIDIIKQKKIFIPINIKILFLFSFFLILSLLWSIDGNLAIATFKTVFVLISFYLIVYNFLLKNNKDNSSTITLMKIIMYAGIIFSVYILLYYGISKYFNMIRLGLRIGEEIDNVNRIGLETSVSYLLALFFGLNYRKKYLFLVPLPFIVALGTGSRKVVLILTIGTILLVLLKSDKSKIENIIKKLVVGTLFIIIFNFLIDYLSDFSVFTRFEGFLNSITGSGKVDSSTLERKLFIKYGWEQFLMTPFLGIGAGNSGYITMKVAGWWTYLHNNYIELLATTGIIGFVLYYYNFYYLLKGLVKLKTKKIFDTNLKKFSLIFILLLLILDYVLVSYNSKITYIYLLIPLICLDRRPTMNSQ